MKIGNCAPTLATTPVSTGNILAHAAEAPHESLETSIPEDNPSPSAMVAVSDTASLLLERGSNAFDTDKVERIRQSIADGTYKINADAIADKLLANAQDLLGHLGKTA